MDFNHWLIKKTMLEIGFNYQLIKVYDQTDVIQGRVKELMFWVIEQNHKDNTITTLGFLYTNQHSINCFYVFLLIHPLIQS